MYKFIKTIKQLVVSLYFISEDLTLGANSQGQLGATSQRKLGATSQTKLGATSQRYKFTGSHFPKIKDSHVCIKSSIMPSSIRQSSITQSRINVLSICTSKQVVEHVSPPRVKTSTKRVGAMTHLKSM